MKCILNGSIFYDRSQAIISHVRPAPPHFLSSLLSSSDLVSPVEPPRPPPASQPFLSPSSLASGDASAH